MGSEKGTSKAGSDGSRLQGISEPNRPNSSLPPKRDEKVTETFLSQKITTLSQKTVILLNTSTTAGSTLLCSTGLTPPSDTNLPCILSCSTSHSYQKTKPQNPHSERTAPAARVSSVCVGGEGVGHGRTDGVSWPAALTAPRDVLRGSPHPLGASSPSATILPSPSRDRPSVRRGYGDTSEQAQPTAFLPPPQRRVGEEGRAAAATGPLPSPGRCGR